MHDYVGFVQAGISRVKVRVRVRGLGLGDPTTRVYESWANRI